MGEPKIHAFTPAYVASGAAPCGLRPPQERTSAVHALVTCLGCQHWITFVETRARGES